MDPRDNPQIDTSNWIKTKKKKQEVVDMFIDFYADDLAGTSTLANPADQEHQQVVRLASLSILRVLVSKDNVWIMPVGSVFSPPASLPPVSNQNMQNIESLARLQAAVVYDYQSGGMSVFDFGNSVTLKHSSVECMQRYASDNDLANQPSVMLIQQLLRDVIEYAYNPQQIYPADYANDLPKYFSRLRQFIVNHYPVTTDLLHNVGLNSNEIQVTTAAPNDRCGCEIILLSQADALNAYTSRSIASEAYVRKGEHLIYLSHNPKIKKAVAVNEQTLAAFDQALKITLPTEQCTRRFLSRTELDRITEITQHQTLARNDYSFEIGVMPLLPEIMDLQIYFGPVEDGCRLTVTNAALKPIDKIRLLPVAAPPVIAEDPDPVVIPSTLVFTTFVGHTGEEPNRSSEDPHAKILSLNGLDRCFYVENKLKINYTALDARNRIGIGELWGRRNAQEDRVLVGVLGAAVTDLTRPEIHGVLAQTVADLETRIEYDLGEYAKYQGSCFLMNVIHGGTVYTVSLGDSTSYAVVSNEQGQVEVTQLNPILHNASVVSEQARVILDGGQIYSRTTDGTPRLWGNLAITGALGDSIYNSSGMSHTPYLNLHEFRIPVGGFGFIITACDGLTESNYLTMELIAYHVSLMRDKSPEEIAFALAKLAYIKGSRDNISVVVTLLDPASNTAKYVIVADGHGGFNVAEYVYQNMHKILNANFKAALHLKLSATQTVSAPAGSSSATSATQSGHTMFTPAASAAPAGVNKSSNSSENTRKNQPE